MTASARRLEAAHGIGKPHLWRFSGQWACNLGHAAAVNVDWRIALADVQAMVAHGADLSRYRWGSW